MTAAGPVWPLIVLGVLGAFVAVRCLVRRWRAASRLIGDEQAVAEIVQLRRLAEARARGRADQDHAIARDAAGDPPEGDLSAHEADYQAWHAEREGGTG